MTDTAITDPIALDDIDLADAELHRSGPVLEVFRRLRQHAPVHWNESRGVWGPFWSITRHEDITQISRDPGLFSNARDFKLVPAQADDSILYAQMGKILLTLDPPQHLRLRRLVTSGFTPRFVSSKESEIRAITRATVDEVSEQGSCDFVLDVAAKVPIAVICEKLGIPRSEWPRMFELTNDIIGEGIPEEDEPRQIAGLVAMLESFAGIVARARGGDGADLVLALVAAEIEGDRLTDEEILWFLALLVIAGNESTRNTMAGGIEAFAAHPDQRARLIADPTQLAIAVEEVIRWVSPIGHMARVATRDTEIRGVKIAAGERLVMWYLAANRDEAVFADADRFDITRWPNPHLGFGIGEHFCLGTAFARLELKVVFEEVLTRWPDLSLSRPPTRLLSNAFNGIRSMPVDYTPSSKLS